MFYFSGPRTAYREGLILKGGGEKKPKKTKNTKKKTHQSFKQEAICRSSPDLPRLMASQVPLKAVHIQVLHRSPSNDEKTSLQYY